MAHYVRFEIYIPLTYTVLERDPRTKRAHRVNHSIDEDLVEDFVKEACGKYRGMTQLNPLSPGLKGWWKSEPSSAVEVDFLTFLFGLVRIDQFDDATRFFGAWKQRFEQAERQEVVLLIFYSVQTLGDFLKR